MSNIMQYMLNQTEEFREAYAEILNKIEDVSDRLSVVEIKLSDIEIRVNSNKNND